MTFESVPVVAFNKDKKALIWAFSVIVKYSRTIV